MPELHRYSRRPKMAQFVIPSIPRVLPGAVLTRAAFGEAAGCPVLHSPGRVASGARSVKSPAEQGL